jgi:hypothetical protein
MKVFKYEIVAEDSPTVQLPVGAEILSVGQQNNKMFLWALVDTDEKVMEQHEFRVAGTGHEIKDAGFMDFIGTVQMYDGALVFHVFEVF